MKQTTSNKKRSTPTIEPVIISKLQRTTAAQIARERARAMWRQRASRILLGAVVAAVGLRVLMIAVQPCLAAYRSSRKTELLRAQLQREQERHQHLLSQIRFLKSDQGVEEEARKLGWTKAGEVSLQIVTPEPAPRPGGGTSGQRGTPSPGLAPSPHFAAPRSHISGSERVRLALLRWLQQRKP